MKQVTILMRALGILVIVGCSKAKYLLVEIDDGVDEYVQYDEHDEVRIGNYFICSSSSFWRANNLFKASHSTVFSCQIQLELTCYFALQKIRNERFQLRVLYLPWENWDQVTRDPLIILPLEFADMPPDQQKSFLTFLLFWVLRTVSQQPQNFGSGTLHLRTRHGY